MVQWRGDKTHNGHGRDIVERGDQICFITEDGREKCYPKDEFAKVLEEMGTFDSPLDVEIARIKEQKNLPKDV
ncbi:hypothetical protein [Candidatus Borrarchaeum sp.]|uniref:hypothetical protein n=1 Tax=Candidatus Borrarchaeum sp. TaxID=2846742 RepID=UPI00257ADD15|nr:hypothetical protein [Candidatus Borrarchaeum sp.]